MWIWFGARHEYRIALNIATRAPQVGLTGRHDKVGGGERTPKPGGGVRALPEVEVPGSPNALDG